jgi:phytoene dehydrogenase-like protein
MCGLQGAVAIPRGGPAALADVLLRAARNAGVEIRTGARVTQLIVEGDAIAGAVVATGEVVLAETVLSSLSRRTTLLEFLPPGAAGFATARQLERPNEASEGKVVVALNALPPTFKQPARYVIAEKMENSVSAHARASAGRVPSDLALEAVVIETGAEPPFLLSVMVRPLPVVPVDPPKAFATRLLQTVLRTLERNVPALTANIAGFNFLPARPRDPLSVLNLTASWRERIATPVRGLFLCGEAAEPLPAASCRAARIAAGLVGEHLKRARP